MIINWTSIPTRLSFLDESISLLTTWAWFRYFRLNLRIYSKDAEWDTGLTREIPSAAVKPGPWLWSQEILLVLCRCQEYERLVLRERILGGRRAYRSRDPVIWSICHSSMGILWYHVYNCVLDMLKYVKCYPGGRKIDLISSICDILSLMWYHWFQYTKRIIQA